MYSITKNLNQICISSMSTIVDQYDAFLIDIWGVIHDGYNAYPGSIECINQILDRNKKIIFLSNAPIPGILAKKKLLDHGIKPNVFQVLSSGDLIRHQLLHFEDSVFKNLGRRFYHLIPTRNSDILSDMPAQIVNKLEEANFILLTAYAEEGEDLNQYGSLFKKAISLEIPVICANPDKTVISGDKNRYCAGIFSEQYENLGGKVYYYGKPHLPIYEYAIRNLNRSSYIDKRRILMIGDTLETDILGAKNAGLDSLVVLSGNMNTILKKETNFETLPEKLGSILTRHALIPNWILNSLTW
jgi:HAD superfamily hydrolase (TIGR01459 family)